MVENGQEPITAYLVGNDKIVREESMGESKVFMNKWLDAVAAQSLIEQMSKNLHDKVRRNRIACLMPLEK